MLKKMRTNIRAALLGALGALGPVLIACSGTGGALADGPNKQPEITTPTSGLTVTATIASVALEDYGQGSNVQIAFNASDSGKSARVEVVNVTLLDSATGGLVDTLAASKPQIWNGNGYTAWDQSVTPGGDLKASYDLTSPQWSTIDGDGTGTRGSYSKSYKLRLELRIDGVQVILDSTDLNRQPQAVT
jgi:hypothetical protein